MQTIPVQYTDRIHGFQGRFLKVVSKAELKMALGRNSGIDEADWKLRCAIVRLTRRHHERTCGSRNVSAYFRRTRYIQGEPWGEMQTFYEVDMHMLTCNDCGNSFYESLPFLSHPMSRITKSGSSANRRKPQGSAATHPNTAGRFGAPRCRVGTPPLPRRLRRAA